MGCGIEGTRILTAPDLVIFGCGYSASRLLELHRTAFGTIAATFRRPEQGAALTERGILAFDFTAREMLDPLVAAIEGSRCVLVSTAPDEAGDPVLNRLSTRRGAFAGKRIVYLSTVGVYGDHAGAWVDEDTPARPLSARSRQRLAAEQAWWALGAEQGAEVIAFRLSGIYGPGRNALCDLRAGAARRIIKPGQVFNRIHVDDIAGAILAAFRSEAPERVYNVTDCEPAPPQDVVAFAADLLGVPPPPEIDFATADLSPMARSFYGEVKRVANRRLHQRLGYALLYPTYREGLGALAAAGEGR